MPCLVVEFQKCSSVQQWKFLSFNCRFKFCSIRQRYFQFKFFFQIDSQRKFFFQKKISTIALYIMFSICIPKIKDINDLPETLQISFVKRRAKWGIPHPQEVRWMTLVKWLRTTNKNRIKLLNHFMKISILCRFPFWA